MPDLTSTPPVLAAGGGPGAVQPQPPADTLPASPPATDPSAAPATTDPGAAPAGDTVVQSRYEFTWLPWALAALLLGVLLLYTFWQRRRAPRPQPVAALQSTSQTGSMAPAAPPPAARPPAVDSSPPLAADEERATAARPLAAQTPELSSPDAPAPSRPSSAALHRPWRVSLLAHDDPALHAQRAVTMAAGGYEGSSLAEFLITLDINPDFEFNNIPGFYDMPPAGYMALARAYATREHVNYARALLRLALDQYPGDPYLAHFLAHLNAEPAE